jgi:hypothetical protein
MIPIGEHATVSARGTVHGAREPRGYGVHAAPEGLAVVCLDEQVRVIALERVVHEPEPRTLASGSERTFDLLHDANDTQRRNVIAHPQGDVCGEALERGALQVPHAAILLVPWLAARAITPAAPPLRCVHRQSKLSSSVPHLD